MDELESLIADIGAERREYPNDTVLSLIERLATQLRRHTCDSSHVHSIGSHFVGGITDEFGPEQANHDDVMEFREALK